MCARWRYADRCWHSRSRKSPAGQSVRQQQHCEPLYQQGRDDYTGGFKVPKGMTIVAELPKTATGRIQKYVLPGGPAGIVAQ